MFGVGAAADDADPHIRDLGTREHAPVAPLLQMGHDQTLPVEGQVVDRTMALEDQSAAGLAGLQQQVDLRVVPQGFEMSDSFHRVCNGLFVNDPRRTEFDLHAETLSDQALQDLPLDLAHDLDGDLLFLLVIGEAEHGILFLQSPEFSVGSVQVLAGRQDQPALHDGLEQALCLLFVCLRAQPHAGPGPCQARYGDYDAGGCLLQGFVFFSFVEAKLGCLFGLSFFVGAFRDLLSGHEGSAGDLHPGQPRAAASAVYGIAAASAVSPA